MKYKNKYRIESIRKPGWDYNSPGSYFITINEKNRRCVFGGIQKGIMKYSMAGKYAEECWKEIPVHFPHASLGSYVIMPDHMHGIINLGDHPDLGRARRPGMSKVSPASGSLPSILRSYKRAVGLLVRRDVPGFEWQSRFHDRIIPDAKAYDRITKYIENNIKNWKR